MSTFNDIDIDCEHCGETFRGTVWVGVHVGQDPELKDLLLGGELNLVPCPHCTYVAFQDQFLLYQDPAAELVAYVYPESQQPQEPDLQKMMLQGFEAAQETVPVDQRKNYAPQLIFGLESLIEQLTQEVEIAEQSQIAQEICREHNIAITMLRPAEARKRHSVRVLPRTGSTRLPTRKEVLAGIDQLLQLNPALNLYQQLQQAIQADATWSL